MIRFPVKLPYRNVWEFPSKAVFDKNKEKLKDIFEFPHHVYRVRKTGAVCLAVRVDKAHRASFLLSQRYLYTKNDL